MDVHATTFLHDWPHKATLWPNQGVVQLWWNGHLHLCNVCLDKVKRMQYNLICVQNDVWQRINYFNRNWTRHVYTYQLLLNGQDAISCSLTVCLLSGDDNHLRVAVLSRQVNLCVRLLSNLDSQKAEGLKNCPRITSIQATPLMSKVPSWCLSHLFQLCFCGTAWRWGLRQSSCSPPSIIKYLLRLKTTITKH